MKFTRINDPEDFQIPYRVYGQIDLEIMQAKYKKLKRRKHYLTTPFLEIW